MECAGSRPVRLRNQLSYSLPRTSIQFITILFVYNGILINTINID